MLLNVRGQVLYVFPYILVTCMNTSYFETTKERTRVDYILTGPC